MALSSLRLRRSLSTLRRSLTATPSLSPPSPSSSSSSSSRPLFPCQSPSPALQKWSLLLLQSRAFRSSSASLFSSRQAYGGGNNPGDEIGPDTILFEGCDYNHWLIVMDFPKDPRPSSEEMVRTYEETCAKGLNISLEEAKQKMYACSTTTYTGFQAVMTEKESEQFNGLPGVIFVLPDSYIDPQNKEYGGDKYINGTIIPRPPPIQYGRQTARYRDRSRSPDQPRYDRQRGPIPNQQGNPSYGYQGPMQGQPNDPSYGYQGPMHGRPNDPSYGYQGPMQGQPNDLGNRSYGPQRQIPNQQPPTQGGGWNYGPTQNYPSQQNYAPPGQGERRDPMPMNGPGSGNPYQQGSYNQSGPGNFSAEEQRQWDQGDQRNYAQPRQQGGFREDFRNHGQGMVGGQGQGFHRQGVNSGSIGQAPTSDYGQSYPGYQGQNFGEQRNAQGQQSNYPPVDQTRTDQGC